MQSARSRHSRGFSLVELLVGIVIAMLAVVVIMQIFRLSEGMRRSSSGGDDAQTTGAVAMSLLLRDLRQAGQGINSASLLGCSLTLPNARTLGNLGPVLINASTVAAGDTGTDTLLVTYGSGNGSPEGDLINSQSGTTVFNVATPTAFSLSDYVIATPQTRASPCSLTLDKVNVTPSTSVTVASGASGMANGALFDLGRTPRVAAFRVSNGRLAVCDYLTQDCSSSSSSNWSEVAEGVVSLRAQYAKDTSSTMDGIVDSDGYNQTTPTAYCSGTAGWSRVVAMRLVLVVRNGQKEKEPDTDKGETYATSSAPTWSGSSDAAISLTGNSDWKLYRYKTFETTLPLRNISWSGAVSGC